MLRKKNRIIIRVEAQVLAIATRDPDTGDWVAVCDALNITSSAPTWSELLQDVDDALQLLLTDLFEEGELSAFLQKKGWRTAATLPEPHGIKPRFDVPFSMNPMSVEEMLATT